MRKVGNKYHCKVGEITYQTPEIPKREEIVGHDLPKSEQMWRRIIMPSDEAFNQMTPIEQNKVIVDDLKSRMNGMWFFNNGTPTYIPGDYYFYLNHWWMGAATPDGYPQYKQADLEDFYYWDYCEKDENCFGYLLLSGRRFGKTERALARIYNKISMFEEKHGGLMSLTLDDAKKNLFQRIVRSWKRLPEYIKPLDEGMSDPKAALNFRAPSARSTTFKKRTYKKALGSWIDYEATQESAYQGKKLFRILLDEPGTIKEMDLIEWFSTTKKCLVLGANIAGKMMLPATIENMKIKGGEAYRIIWEQSDFTKKNANGRTQSGLYRYFNPAYRGFEGFVDKYGNDMMDESGEYKAKIWLQAERDGATDEEKINLKRQFPFTEEEAFDIIASDSWEDDVKAILQHVRTDILQNDPPILYASLYEISGNIQMKEASKNKEGVVKIYEKPMPDVKYIAGIDSAGSDKQTGSIAGSKVAMVVLKGFHGMDKENYLPVCTFSVRPTKLEDAYQTILLISKLYGQYGQFQVLGETNAGQGSAIVAYFANRGAIKFIMKKPRNLGFNYNDKMDKYWIYRNDDIKQAQIILANQFIRLYGQNIRFKDLIEDLIKFGKENTDEADAFLMAILALGNFNPATQNNNRQAKRQRQVRTMRVAPDGSVYSEWITVDI